MIINKIYIRNETLKNEYRTPIIPEHIHILINLGFTIYVQSSSNRFCLDRNRFSIFLLLPND